jgi:hypothetical protein
MQKVALPKRCLRSRRPRPTVAASSRARVTIPAPSVAPRARALLRSGVQDSHSVKRSRNAA